MEFFTKLNDRAAEQISGGAPKAEPLPVTPDFRNFGEEISSVTKFNLSVGVKPKEGASEFRFKNSGQAIKRNNPANRKA